MGTLNIVRLHNLYCKVKASVRSLDAVRVSSLMSGCSDYSFHREALYRLRGSVASLLSQLPDSMMQSQSQYSVPWIQARFNWQSTPWALALSDVDLLLALGRALGMVSVVEPDYPCTLPYVQILNVDASRKERLSACRNSRLSRWDYTYLRHPSCESATV